MINVGVMWDMVVGNIVGDIVYGCFVFKCCEKLEEMCE